MISRMAGAAIGGVLVALVGGWCVRDRSVREGRWLERERQLLAAVDSADKVTRATDTVRIRDSVAHYVSVTRWDTVRLRDTVVVESVVYVRRDSADSVVVRCQRANASCEAARRALVAERDQWKALAELRGDDPRRRRWYDRIGVSAGYGVNASTGGEFSHGFQVTAGVKLWPP